MPLSKIMFAVRAKPGLTRAQALEHLATRHAPLVAASPTVRSRLRTYVQNRAVDAPAIPDQTSDRDWLIEGWRDMSAPLPDPPKAADAIALREDEARFPDRATLLALAVEPARVHGAPEADAAIKIFSYLRRASGTSSEAFAQEWSDAAALLVREPVFTDHCREFVRNVAVPGEGAPAHANAGPSATDKPAYDGIDTWRFENIAAAQDLFADPGFAGPLEAYLSTVPVAFRFVAQEHVIFDDAGVAS